MPKKAKTLDPFFCKVDTEVKLNFDVATIKNRKIDGTREEIIEKLLSYYAKKGLPK